MRRREGCHSEERDTNTNWARTKNDQGAFQLAVNDQFVCEASPRTARAANAVDGSGSGPGGATTVLSRSSLFASRSSRLAAHSRQPHGPRRHQHGTRPHHEHLMLENIRQSSSTAEIGRLNDGIDNHRPAGSILKLKELAKCRPGLEVPQLRRS